MTDRPDSEVPPRPSPRPSATSRARRNAVAVPDPLRRPSPRPVDSQPSPAPLPAPQPAAAGTRPEPDARYPAGPSELAGTAPIEGARPALRRARGPARRGLLASLSVLIVALAVLDGWLVAARPESGSRTQRDQALASAKAAVPLILSYDYRRFDENVATAKSRLTGRATTDYVQAMAKTIKPTATKVHAVVQAQTDGAGVESVSGSGKQVTVVVFGEQKVTNSSLTAPRTDLFRVRVRLERVGGQWLVSQFDQI